MTIEAAKARTGFAAPPPRDAGDAADSDARPPRPDRGQPASPRQSRSPSETAARLRRIRRQDLFWQVAVGAGALTLAAGFAAWVWIDLQTFAEVEREMAAPPNWNEQLYLAENPDVAAGVRRGRFASGWQHYLFHGVEEGRRGVTVEDPPADRQ